MNKRKTDLEKEREPYVSVKSKDGKPLSDQVIQSSFSYINGKISIEEYEQGIKNSSLEISTGYHGETKERDMTRFASMDFRYCSSMDEAIKDFDIVCATDTSMKKIGNWYYTDSTTCIPVFNPETSKYDIHCAFFETLRHNREPIHYEEYNWLRAINALKDKYPERSEKILMIVDCNKDKIWDYNQRTLEVSNNTLLPEGVKLIYASSEKITNWTNELIRASDKCCKKQIKILQDSERHSYPQKNSKKDVFQCADNQKPGYSLFKK